MLYLLFASVVDVKVCRTGSLTSEVGISVCTVIHSSKQNPIRARTSLLPVSVWCQNDPVGPPWPPHVYEGVGVFKSYSEVWVQRRRVGIRVQLRYQNHFTSYLFCCSFLPAAVSDRWSSEQRHHNTYSDVEHVNTTVLYWQHHYDDLLTSCWPITAGFLLSVFLTPGASTNQRRLRVGSEQPRTRSLSVKLQRPERRDARISSMTESGLLPGRLKMQRSRWKLQYWDVSSRGRAPDGQIVSFRK